jgi:hypothetical protein
MRLPLPETHDLSTEILDLVSEVHTFDDKEGVVLWSPQPDRSYHLTKFKSAWYLRLHALRSQATPRYVREFCYMHDVRDLAGLKSALAREGFDWEVMSFIEPLFEEYIKGFLLVEERLEELENYVKSHLLLLPTRKEIALAAKAYAEELGDESLFAYLIASATNDAKAKDIAESMKLGMTLTQFRALMKAGVPALGSAPPPVDD